MEEYEQGSRRGICGWITSFLGSRPLRRGDGPPVAGGGGRAHHHDSGVKALRRGACATAVYLTKCRGKSENAAPAEAGAACDRDHPSQGFLQGRQDEQRVDASALRADEGRGIAAISVGEPRAGIDPTISEWGNPATFASLPP